MLNFTWRQFQMKLYKRFAFASYVERLTWAQRELGPDSRVWEVGHLMVASMS